jgi:hypothetical protein
VRFTCPCCGYPTLAGRGTIEICSLCWWEDDGQDDADADEVMGGPNSKYSLAEARDNFELYLVMYPAEEDRRVSGPDSEAEKQIKLKIIAAFDEMLDSPTRDSLNKRWQDVRDGERALQRVLKQRIQKK